MFPVDADDFEDFRESLQKLRLNDSALQLRAGELHRAGLWLSHRLPRHAAHGNRAGASGARIQPQPHHHRAAAWSTRWCCLTAASIKKIDNPAELPEAGKYDEIREPIILARVLMPPDYVGSVMQLCMEKRGVQKNLRYLGSQVQMEVEMPLAEVVLDFFDRLKSVSRGYASFEYEFVRFQAA